MNDTNIADSLIKLTIWLLKVDSSKLAAENDDVIKCVVAKSLSKVFSGGIAKSLIDTYDYIIYLKSRESKGSRMDKGKIFRELINRKIAIMGSEVIRVINRFKTKDGFPSFGSMLNWFGGIVDRIYGWSLPNKFIWKALEILFDEMDVDFEILEVGAILDRKLPVSDLFISPICDYSCAISFYGNRYQYVLGKKLGADLEYYEREYTEDFLIKLVTIALHNEINFDHDDHCLLVEYGKIYGTMIENVINHEGCTCNFINNLPTLYSIGVMVYNEEEEVRRDSTFTIRNLVITPKILADQIKEEVRLAMN